jgi:RNA polymerase sigma-70 factor (ECF subfamily)
LKDLMDRDEELRLVTALRAGDETAFVPVYDAYRSRVFTFILRMVQRRAIAEELAQEVWMRLAVRAASLRDDTRLEAWLFTVARNLCASYWRTRGIEGLQDTDQDDLERLPEPARASSPDRTTEGRELRTEIEHALARVPLPYREALLLAGVHGMTPAAAAAVCGISPEAMRKRLERARDMLAEQMRTTRHSRVSERQP